METKRTVTNSSWVSEEVNGNKSQNDPCSGMDCYISPINVSLFLHSGFMDGEIVDFKKSQPLMSKSCCLPVWGIIDMPQPA